jgi:hypothetical protein
MLDCSPASLEATMADWARVQREVNEAVRDNGD